MNSLSGPFPGELNEAATAVRRALLLTVRQDDFAAIDSALAALDRPPAERVDSGDKAIAVLRSGGFDLMIVDLVRDGMAHLAAIERLRSDVLLSGIVCVAISADVQSTPTQKAIEIGIDDVLREPLDRSVARLCFSACLERRKLRDDSLQYWMATASDETDDHARALLDALPEAVVALRQDGAIDLANAGAERMFGLSGGALIGTPFSALVSRAVDDGRGNTWTPETLENLRGPSMAILRLPGGFSRPIEILCNPYKRFGRDLIACVLREVDWVSKQQAAPAVPVHSAVQGEGPNGLRANAELLHELAKEVTTRLDLIGRNINMMTDEVFGPVGVAIYKSYLSEAVSGIDQARALLDGAAHPDKERRKDSNAETALRELVTEIIAKRQRNAERRRIAIEIEIEFERRAGASAAPAARQADRGAARLCARLRGAWRRDRAARAMRLRRSPAAHHPDQRLRPAGRRDPESRPRTDRPQIGPATAHHRLGRPALRRQGAGRRRRDRPRREQGRHAGRHPPATAQVG